MIYFDWQNLKILIYIRMHKRKGVSWGKVLSKFSTEDDDCGFLLTDFAKEWYTVVKDDKGKWIIFDKIPYSANADYRIYITEKGNELIERKFVDLLRWFVPTAIALASLLVSVIALILSA